MDRVAFSVLGVDIYWYALIIVSSVIIAMWLSTRESVRVGLQQDDVSDFVLVGIPVAFIGARLYYILFNLDYYLQQPAEMLNLRSGGLAIYGGLIAGGIWLYFFCRRKFIPTWTFLDVATPSVLLAQAIGRWGNFMNQEAFGEPTTHAFLQSLHLPKFIVNQMYIEGVYRQPTFLYESVWNVLGFIVLICVRKYAKWLKVGELSLLYVMWYSFGRFFIEGMRTDSLYGFIGLRVSQVLSALLFIGAGVIFIWRRRHVQELKQYNRSFGKDEAII